MIIFLTDLLNWQSYFFAQKVQIVELAAIVLIMLVFKFFFFADDDRSEKLQIETHDVNFTNLLQLSLI